MKMTFAISLAMRDTDIRFGGKLNRRTTRNAIARTGRVKILYRTEADFYLSSHHKSCRNVVAIRHPPSRGSSMRRWRDEYLEGLTCILTKKR